MSKTDIGFKALGGLGASLWSLTLYWIFFRAPTAQLQAGGITQRIFYFHVPSATGLYICGTICLIASVLYLKEPLEKYNSLAQASAECAALFGFVVLTSGPLWAKKAWGTYWTWDPRLTTLLLSVIIYVSIIILRNFTGDGSAERRFAAAIGVFGTANLPIIHYSVKKWGGIHPKVVSEGGGGLGHPDMRTAFLLGMISISLLSLLTVWLRYKIINVDNRIKVIEDRLLDED